MVVILGIWIESGPLEAVRHGSGRRTKNLQEERKEEERRKKEKKSEEKNEKRERVQEGSIMCKTTSWNSQKNNYKRHVRKKQGKKYVNLPSVLSLWPFLIYTSSVLSKTEEVSEKADENRGENIVTEVRLRCEDKICILFKYSIIPS